MSSLPVSDTTGSPLSRRGLILAGAALAGPIGSLGSASAAAAAGRDASSKEATIETCCPIVELRQYTLRSGRREAFIALFEANFVESQEAAGMRLIGQFRDLDDPDRFVWLRGFPDMASRPAALSSFYGGPIWKAHRNEANASINDSDNVLLLRMASPASGFPVERLRRLPTSMVVPAQKLVLAGLQYLDADRVDEFTAFFEARMRPHLEQLKIPVIAEFKTETSPNNFPGLPIRDTAHVFAWFSVCADEDDCDAKIRRLRASQIWRNGASDPILHQLARKPELLRLKPTYRSALRD
jgi:hypothetical protein